MKNKHSGFSGSLGFVLAAADSAVGVGNIWRFPYLCAKDGGGLFLLVYLVLVLTFGFTLLTTDVAIGRRTKQNALNAFGTLHKKWRFLGYLTFLVPTLIMTYYSVIGGWIAKYFAVYLVSDPGGSGWLLYLLHHLSGLPDRLYAAVPGTDGMASGPSLTFISLPRVFASMGGVGRIVGIVFFLALGFAALTSCVSVMETLVANCMEIFHKSRKEMCAIFSGDRRDHLPWLQRVLLRADSAQRQRRSASGRDGLHQQQLPDALYQSPHQHPDRLGHRPQVGHR